VVFTSLDYLLLLLITFSGYWLLPARVGPWLLLAASGVFYAHWSVPFLGLVAASIVVGWGCALGIEAARGRTRGMPPGIWLLLCALLLLGSLAGFKYANLLLDLWVWLGGRPRAPFAIALPLAISFYTFQILGYVVDVGRGQAAERSLLRFGVFVGFFPQLIAGPIVRAHQLLPQLARRAAFDADRVLSGLLLIAYGTVKKTVFADNLGDLVDRVYRPVGTPGGVDVLIATLAFGAQIYCDFSGYTDIARGSGRLLGIELPINFRSPHVARSIADFWRRWHITLSSWLRDYLYVPLGGNRVSRPRLLANLFLTMLLGGLWHGASATFVLWGAYHGLLLVVERVGRDLRGSSGARRHAASQALAWLATFVAVQLGWVLFRAGDLATLVHLGRRVVAAPTEQAAHIGSLDWLPLVLLTYLLHAASGWLRGRPTETAPRLRAWLSAPALAASVVLVLVFGGSSEAFIYFRF